VTPKVQRPTYYAEIWRQFGFWVGRVINASAAAPPYPFNLMAQCERYDEIESRVRQLIATETGHPPGSFDIEYFYQPLDIK